MEISEISYDENKYTSKYNASDINTVIKSILKTVGDWLIGQDYDKPAIYEIGIKLKDKEDSIYMAVLPTEYEYKNQQKYENYKIQRVDLRFEKSDKTDVADFNDVGFNDKDMLEAIMSYISDKFNEDEYGKVSLTGEIRKMSDTNSSNKMKVTLKKIQTSEGYDVNLVSVNADCDLDSALVLVDSLSSDDDFISEIPVGQDVSYEILDDSDDICVQDCDPFEPDMSSISVLILQNLLCLRNDLQMMKYNTVGHEAQFVKDMCMSTLWFVDDMIDKISNLAFQYCGYCPDHMSIVKEMSSSDDTTVSCQSALYKIKEDLLSTLACLDLFYCDFPHEIQAIIDSWMNSINTYVSDINRFNMEA